MILDQVEQKFTSHGTNHKNKKKQNYTCEEENHNYLWNNILNRVEQNLPLMKNYRSIGN